MKKPSILIIGQGIAGSLLALELIKQKCNVHIIDNDDKDAASKKAAGIYNPITGRNMTLTWKYDVIFEKIASYYAQIEKITNCQFHTQLAVYRPFDTIANQNDWMAKATDSRFIPFIQKTQIGSSLIPQINDPIGGIVIKKTGFIDVKKMISALRKYFFSQNMLTQSTFTYSEYSKLQYDKIIFCEGAQAVHNPWWQHLPFALLRGEILAIRCPLVPKYIYNKGVFILPFGQYFKVGSSYDRELLTNIPQKKGVLEIENKLKKLYVGPYEKGHALAGIRPATVDRKPFIGWHPKIKNIGIFNGFGTKGVSLVPYFAKLFSVSIVNDSEIMSEVNVNRVL